MISIIFCSPFFFLSNEQSMSSPIFSSQKLRPIQLRWVLRSISGKIVKNSEKWLKMS